MASRAKETKREAHSSKNSVYNSIRQLLLFPLNHFSIWWQGALERLIGGRGKKEVSSREKKSLTYKISARSYTAQAKNELIRLFYTLFLRFSYSFNVHGWRYTLFITFAMMKLCAVSGQRKKENPRLSSLHSVKFVSTNSSLRRMSWNMYVCCSFPLLRYNEKNSEEKEEILREHTWKQT